MSTNQKSQLTKHNKEPPKTIYTYFNQDTGFGMDRSITPGIVNNTYNLLYNIRCMNYKKFYIEEVEALHLNERNNFSFELKQILIEGLYSELNLFQTGHVRTKFFATSSLLLILLSLYSDPHHVYIKEGKTTDESVEFELFTHFKY